MFFQHPFTGIVENALFFQFPFPDVIENAVFFQFPFPGVIEKAVFFHFLFFSVCEVLCFSSSLSLSQFPSSSLPSSLRGFPAFFQGKCVATFFKVIKGPDSPTCQLLDKQQKRGKDSMGKAGKRKEMVKDWCGASCACKIKYACHTKRRYLPHKVKADVSKRHACHAKGRGVTAPWLTKRATRANLVP